MQKLSHFWKKDIVNKLIAVIAVLLTVGISALIAAFLFLMPSGKSASGLVGEIFPTNTLEPRLKLTQIAEDVLTQVAAATASVPPTITTMPFTPFAQTPTSESGPALVQIQASPSPTATVTFPAPSATLMPTSTSTPVAPTKSIATSTLTGTKPAPSAAPQTGSPVNTTCIPVGPAQKGKVLDVLDGNTIKVLIDGLAYVVRYIGIETPVNPYYAKLATLTNGDLVFAQEVTLIPDVADKDSSGRLLRYVKAGDKFPSIELLEKGLATAVDMPPNLACSKTYQNIAQTARDNKVGLWIPTPTFPIMPTP